MIHVALLSRWHVHASDYAHQAAQHPDIKITEVWDEIPERGQAWADELGVSFESDLSTVLSNPSIDAVIVDTPTNMHKDVIIQAARNGKHIFTEKVLAFTVENCEEIFRAVETANVQFMISLPRLVEPFYLYAQDMVDLGILGKLNMIRCRIAHNGAIPFEGHPNGWLPTHFFDAVQCGGGALIDLGAHPIYLTNRLAGPVKAVTARLTSFLDSPVDDNAVVLVEYESGALGVIEAGFVTNNSPFLLELHGTEGSLLIEDSTVRIKSSLLAGEGWVVPETMPAKLLSPMEQWVIAIKKGILPTITKVDAFRLTQFNQAAARSHVEGRRIEI